MRLFRWTLALLVLTISLVGCNNSNNSNELTPEQQSSINTFQSKLDDLKARIDSAATDARARASDAGQSMSDSLHTAWDTAKDKLARLKTASASEWEQDRASLQNSLNDLSMKVDNWFAKMKESATTESATTVPMAPNSEPIEPNPR